MYWWYAGRYFYLGGWFGGLQSSASMRRTSVIASPGSKPKSKFPTWKAYWTEFCHSTPVHGVRYLVETDRPFYERLWWAVVLLACFYFATIYSWALWNRLMCRPTDFPTQTVTRYESSKEVPFPAMTFCDNIKSTNPNMSNDMKSFICGADNGTAFEINTKIDINHIKEMAPPFKSSCTIDYHRIAESYVSDCEKMFTRIVTQNGVCYTFNLLDKKDMFQDGVLSHYDSHGRRSDWSVEKGYTPGLELAEKNGSTDALNLGPYPKRALFALFLEIYPSSEGASCPDVGPGVKVAVHSPADLPKFGHIDSVWIPVKDEDFKNIDFVEMESGKEYYINAEPTREWRDKDFESIPLNERRCYFKGEKKLAFFKEYSEANCENECLVNHTMLDCKCVDFYMPYYNGTEFCGPDQLICLMDDSEWWKKQGKKNCTCYPSCVSLKYNFDIYFKRIPHMEKNNTIKLVVYMHDDFYNSNQLTWIKPPYVLVDFIANCGGVFGLFCGLSIVSVLELAYYASIRLLSNVAKKRGKIQGGE